MVANAVAVESAGVLRSEVAEAVSRWVWVPADARRVETDSMLMVEYPESFQHRCQVVRVDHAASAARVLDDVSVAAGKLSADRVLLWAGLAPSSESGPARVLEQELGRRGAHLVEEVAILAGRVVEREETGAAPPPASSALSVQPVESANDFAEYTRISAHVFGGAVEPQNWESLEARAAEIRREWAAGRGGEVLARRNGVAVGAAGLTVAGPHARLWGAAVLPEFRRTGVYRALLHMRLAAATGASLAVVKARTQSSAPILLRNGFSEFGTERAYLLEADNVSD